MEHPEIKFLYKYRSYNKNSLSVLIDKKIWVSSPSAFNDPFDCKISLDKNYSNSDYTKFSMEVGLDANQYTKDTFQGIHDSYENGKLTKTARHAVDSAFKDIQKQVLNTGVFSLSESKSNLLLWSHYADSHRGFCIEFERSPDSELGKDKQTSPVEYKKEFPIIKLSEIAPDGMQLLRAILTKAIDWKYEKEWRMFFKKADTHHDLPARISSIIFGCRMAEKHKTKIKNIMNDDDIIFKEAKISPTSYKLDIVTA